MGITPLPKAFADKLYAGLASKSNTIEKSLPNLIGSDDRDARFNSDDITNNSGLLFLRNREKNHDSSQGLSYVLDVIQNLQSVDEIKSISGLENNKEKLHELFIIENMLLNVFINEIYLQENLYLRNNDNLDSINPVIKLILLIFYCTKNMEIDEKEDPNARILPNIQIRRRYLMEKSIALIQEAFTVACQNQDERQEFVDELTSRLKGIKPRLDIPKSAPELYKERVDRKERPDAFIRRVYAEWLGRGLLRPHIKDLDKPLYQALYKHGIPDDFETLLPTAQGRAVEHLTRSDSELIESVRSSRRQADQKRRRKSELAR
jgi:hypothetical protein